MNTLRTTIRRQGLAGGLLLAAVLLLALVASIPAAIAADPEDRVRQILEDASTGGTVGLYLKEVNGPVIAAHNESFVFEPASTIKALIHFHAMRQVQDGAMIDGDVVTLDRLIPWFMDQTGSCPDLTTQGFDTLQNGLTAMMVPSDNRWTQAMRDFFGDANINATMPRA
ncbi:MAG: serine hydrolase [Chloroflexi bacterium]|nr:serine hydrolase [Chloroflexota bacterium]